MIATAALAVVAAALGAALVLRGRAQPAEATAPPVQFRQLTFQSGTVWSARFAPDEQSVVYAGAWNGGASEIFVASREFPAPKALGIAPGDLLDVSRDGEMALMLAAQFYESRERNSGRLARAHMSGATAPRELLDDVASAAWLPDGALAVARETEGLRVVEFPIGRRVHATAGWVSSLRVSPDGSMLAFADHPVRGDDRGDIRVATRAGAVQTVVEGLGSIRGVAWRPDGRAIWFSPGFAIREATLAGTARTIYNAAGSTMLYDVGRNGDVLLGVQDERVGISGMLAGDTTERDLTWFDYSVVTDISPDGRTLLFFEAGAVGASRYATALRRADGAAPVRLGEGRALSLSPDGTRVLAMRFSPTTLFVLPTRIGDPMTLNRHGIAEYQSGSWMPDGRRLVFAAHEQERAARLFVQDVDQPDVPPRAFSPAGITYRWHGVRPDGSAVAAVGQDGRTYLYPLTGDQPVVMTGVESGDVPVSWDATGTALFVRQPREFPQRIYRVHATTGRREVFLTLHPSNPSGITRISPVVMTPDGRHYAYSYERDLTKLYVVSGLK